MSLLPIIPASNDIPEPLHHTPWPLQPLAPLLPWLKAGDHLPKRSHVGPDGFQVCLHVQNFAPDEISVKTIDDTIVIEAKHEDRPDDHGEVSRHFRRNYRLPEEFNAKDVVSTLSPDGILTVKVPPETSASKRQNVRHVRIQQTGPARSSVNGKFETIEV